MALQSKPPAQQMRIVGSQPFATPAGGRMISLTPVSRYLAPRSTNMGQAAVGRGWLTMSPQMAARYRAWVVKIKAWAQSVMRSNPRVNTNLARGVIKDPGDNRGSGPPPLIGPPPSQYARAPYNPSAFFAKASQARQQRGGTVKIPVKPNGQLVDPGDPRVSRVAPPVPKPPPAKPKPFNKWQDLMSDDTITEYSGGPKMQGLAKLAGLASSYKRNFYEFDKPTVKQGYKLHISADPDNLDATLVPALNALRALKVPHKVWDPDQLAVTAADPATAHQAGKYITVYPKNFAEAHKVARVLDRALPAAKHQKIPGDAQVFEGKPLYMRYGKFSGNDDIEVPADYRAKFGGPERINDDKDLRQAGKNCPAWMEKRFNSLLDYMKNVTGEIHNPYRTPPAIASQAKSSIAMPQRAPYKLTPEQLAEAQAPKFAQVDFGGEFKATSLPVKSTNFVKPRYLVVDPKNPEVLGPVKKFAYNGNEFSSPMSHWLAVARDRLAQNPNLVINAEGATAKQGGKDLGAMFNKILAAQKAETVLQNDLQKNGLPPKP